MDVQIRGGLQNKRSDVFLSFLDGLSTEVILFFLFSQEILKRKRVYMCVC